MLTAPKSGDNVLNWAKNATREINSNIIHNGIGVKVTRTPNGTNLVVEGNGKSKSSSGETWSMPFDVKYSGMDSSLSGSSSLSATQFFTVLTNGAQSNVYYTIGNETQEITPWITGYEVKLSAELPENVGDKNYFCITFDYEHETDVSAKEFPITYSIETKTDLSGMSDDLGYRFLPFAYIQKIDIPDPEDEDPEPVIGGAYKTVFSVGEGEAEEDFALVQMYHGNFQLVIGGGGSATDVKVARVQSQSRNGIFSVRIFEPDGSYSSNEILCPCDIALTTELPAYTRILAHPVETLYLGGD